jgi:hypothetical protein
MTKRAMTAKMSLVDELRARILQLTGKTTDATDVEHLRKRIAELEKGGVVSLWLSASARAVLARMAKEEGISQGKLVVRALADYANENIHRHPEAALALREEKT